MAEFCRQCAEWHFPYAPKFWNDFANMVTEEEWEDGYAAVVLCEGCGTIQVDPEGRCVSSDCLKHGRK